MPLPRKERVLSSRIDLPLLITPGVIATEVHTPLHRVLHVLATRKHIQPSARAGTLRLYDKKAVAMVRYELNLIDARRCRKAVTNAV
jgi:hypothetical protein